MPSPKLGVGHAAARLHHAYRRCGGMAARGARAATGRAHHWVHQRALAGGLADVLQAFHKGLREGGGCFADGENVRVVD